MLFEVDFFAVKYKSLSLNHFIPGYTFSLTAVVVNSAEQRVFLCPCELVKAKTEMFSSFFIILFTDSRQHTCYLLKARLYFTQRQGCKNSAVENSVKKCKCIDCVLEIIII